MIIIDAKDTIAGRIAAFAAKQTLLGQDVRIINAELAVVSGNPKHLMDEERRFSRMGTPATGPYNLRSPDRYLRRIIRGMLPYKTPRGRAAFARVLCHMGHPVEFEGKKITTLKDANVEKLPTLKYTTVKRLCESMGGRT